MKMQRITTKPANRQQNEYKQSKQAARASDINMGTGDRGATWRLGDSLSTTSSRLRAALAGIKEIE